MDRSIQDLARFPADCQETRIGDYALREFKTIRLRSPDGPLGIVAGEHYDNQRRSPMNGLLADSSALGHFIMLWLCSRVPPEICPISRYIGICTHESTIFSRNPQLVSGNAA